VVVGLKHLQYLQTKDLPTQGGQTKEGHTQDSHTKEGHTNNTQTQESSGTKEALGEQTKDPRRQEGQVLVVFVEGRYSIHYYTFSKVSTKLN